MPLASQSDDPQGLEPAMTRWSPTDSLLVAGLVVLAILGILLRFDWRATPIEDAAMLLRYAQNFSHGHGIRWNVNGAPVDGATDFLFMVATGALARLANISVTTASRILVLAAHLFSIVLLFIGGRKILGGNRWICAAMAVYLISGPAVKMAEGCFGAPVFAASLLCCWCAALVYAQGRQSWGWAMLTALFALVSGLVRPEGVLIALIMLGATLYRTGLRRAIPLIASYASVFTILGGSYFLWRWHYFGAPLPNPFYVKGGGHLYPGSLIQAFKNLGELLFPVLPLIPLGWVSSRTRRLSNSLLIVLVCFTGIWMLLNNWNNHFMRFQYAIFPIILFTIPGLLIDLEPMGLPAWRSMSTTARRCAVFAGVLATLGSAGYLDKKFDFADNAAGMRVFAHRLQPFAAAGHSIAVTEAGVLPLYSEWQTIDGIGLNDAYIAHHGAGSVSEYLAQNPPDVIMIHLDAHDMPRPEQLISLYGGEPVRGASYEGFTRMALFAVQHHYTLAAAYGSSPCNLHVYWVRPGIADYDAILHVIRDHPYFFLDNGMLATDYRDLLPPPADCSMGLAGL
jgi:arabinofuranosyltransferase